MTGTFHIVSWDRLEDFLAAGWMVVADLGAVHGRWSCLCEWRCDCVIPDVRNAATSSSVAASLAAAANPVPRPAVAAGTL